MSLLHQKSLALVAPLVGVTAVSGFLLSSRPVSAETASASVTVGAACTFSAVVDIAHTATINPGTYQDDIGKTTFSVTCNDSGGYSIYAIGYGNSEFGNTKLLANISGTLTPTFDINTGTNTSGTSAWAMKLTPRTNLTASNIVNGYGSYSVVPTTYTKVATMVPTTTIPNPTSLEATYRVNISSSQPAGTYSGKVRYTMVNPATETPLQPQPTTGGKIGYFSNAGGVTDTMGDQTASANASVMLWASNFKRPGYGFAGWSDAFDYVANVGSESNPNAHIYGPTEDITTPSDLATKGLSLYAVWVKSAGNLQGFTCPNNTVMPIGAVTALTDTRDNDTYAVAKLADGNCWMIENLRLDNSVILSASNTNNPSLPLTNVYDTGLTSNSLSPTSSVAYNASTAPEGWCSTNSAACDNQSRLRTDNTVSAITNMTGVNANVYSYGNYYNWYSATAGNGLYNAGSNVVVGGDLCPTGWHLPYGGSGTGTKGGNTTGGFYYLGVQIGATASSDASFKIWRTYPNNFLQSGDVYGSSVEYRGNYGFGSYWSSTAGSSNYAYYFNFGIWDVYPGTSNGGKYYGRTVRCVAGA